MLDNAGFSILLKIILPHICLCMPALVRLFIQVSNASNMDSDDAPVKIGNCALICSGLMLVCCITMPLSADSALRLFTLSWASLLPAVALLKSISLSRKSSPKQLLSSMQISSSASHAVCRSLFRLSAFFPAYLNETMK